MEWAKDRSVEIATDSVTIPMCTNSCEFECECCKCSQALCIANSVSSCNIQIEQQPPAVPPLVALSALVSVTIPANSCITKIYASMPNAPTNAKFMFIEVINGAGTTIFCHGVPNLASEGSVFDTTLVQPLCVGGPNDATATVTALNQNNMPVDAFLTLTVVYCPNCC